VEGGRWWMINLYFVTLLVNRPKFDHPHAPR
jgi:hypothetical protein